MAEITDRESLEKWLEDKPQFVGVVVAARGALRVLPMVWSDLERIGEHRFHEVLLATFRASAAAMAVATFPEESRRLKDAAYSAARASEAQPAYQTYAFAAAAYAAAYSTSGPFSEAGRAAAVNAASSADRTVRRGLQEDVSFLEAASRSDGIPSLANRAIAAASSELMRSPLWNDHMPHTIKSDWLNLQAYLRKRAGESWWVWTEWYENTMRGNPYLSELELEKVQIPSVEWKEGPAHVNALIAAMIERHTSRKTEAEPKKPDQPEPRPAPIRFEFRDGKLQKASSYPPASLDQRQATAEQALRGLLELLDDLMAADPGRNSPKLGRLLDRIRAALGDSFATIEIGLLGVHADRLNGYAAQADRILMEEDAADLVSFNVQLGIFVGQFPEWSDYLAGMSDGFGSTEAESKAVEDAGAALDHLKAEARETLADDAVAELDALRDEATPEPSAEGDAAVSDLAKRSFLRAFRDGIAKYCGEAVSKLREGSLDGMKTVGKNAVVVGVAGGAGFLLALATGLPAEFGWLTGMVTYIRRMLKRSDPDAAKNLPDDVMDA